jgi:hypothetical protein
VSTGLCGHCWNGEAANGQASRLQFNGVAATRRYSSSSDPAVALRSLRPRRKDRRSRLSHASRA